MVEDVQACVKNATAKPMTRDKTLLDFGHKGATVLICLWGIPRVFVYFTSVHLYKNNDYRTINEQSGQVANMHGPNPCLQAGQN